MIRWSELSKPLVTIEDLVNFSLEVTEDIFSKRFDGYKTRSKVLAHAIAFNLCGMTESEHWYVHTDSYSDVDGWLYRVWVER